VVQRLYDFVTVQIRVRKVFYRNVPLTKSCQANVSALDMVSSAGFKQLEVCGF